MGSAPSSSVHPYSLHCFTFFHTNVTSARVHESRRPAAGVSASIVSVPFQWQPANPRFGLFGNTFTFLAIAFERYIVAATRQAMPRITDPAVVEEADWFLRQEAQHARAHRFHANAMMAQHPGSRRRSPPRTPPTTTCSSAKPIEFHLAYIANLEATFTPLFKMVFDHRRPLFDGGDERIGTLILWHFVEEIEHRSSALRIHHHVTPDRWYRLRSARQVFDHVAGIYSLILSGFESHVPLDARHVPTSVVGPGGLWLGSCGSRLPGSASGQCVDARPCSRRRPPDHDLAAREIPDAGTRPCGRAAPRMGREWHAAWDSGADVATYAGVRL